MVCVNEFQQMWFIKKKENFSIKKKSSFIKSNTHWLIKKGEVASHQKHPSGVYVRLIVKRY